VPVAPNTLRVVRTDGVEVLNLGIDESFILRSLDLGFPEVRDFAEAIPGMDGEVDTTAHVGARAITAEVTVSQSGTGPLVDRLAAVMHPGARYWLYVGRTDWPGERRILARGASFACPPGSIRTAQMGFRCPSGLLEDAQEQSVTLAPQGQPAGGMSFPVSFSMSFDPGLVPGAALITVGGTVPVAPVIDIYGPCTDPLVRVVNTGAQMRLRGDIAAGDFVRIDTAARTILRNNDPNYSVYGQLDFASSSWPTLPVGQMWVVFSPASSSGACQAVLRWANRWI
jgi:hypothetical protein